MHLSMDFNRLLNFFSLVNILIFSVLVLHIQLNDSYKIGDLKVACGVKYKPGNQDMCLSDVPSQCTSIVLNRNDLGSDGLAAMTSSPAKKPLFLVEDTICFENWQTILTKNPLDIQMFTNIIDTYNLGGLIFDNLYSTDTTTLNDAINDGIGTLLTAIKQYYSVKSKEILLGIVLPNDENIINYGFEYRKIDEYVDVYLCNTTTYTQTCPCTEGSLSPPYKFQKTGNTLASTTPNLFFLTNSKIVMAIQLFVKDAENNQVLSYQETCALSPGTKVCRDSIKELYIKGKLITEMFQFAGAYIRYCNEDDMQGWCYCGQKTQFPGVGAIAAGIEDTTLEYLECPSFGVPGVYRKDANTVAASTAATPSPSSSPKDSLFDKRDPTNPDPFGGQ